MEGQAWQETEIAADFAKIQLAYGNLQGPQAPTTPYKPEPQRWEHNSPGRLQQSPQQRPQATFQQQQSLGWGGDVIPDGAHRIPWFGRSRGKSTGRSRGRGGSSSQSYDRGRRGGRRPYGSGDGEGGDEGLSVEEVVRILQQLPKGPPIPEHVFQALFQFDSRATALLFKDLSKAGVGQRAVELFDWLRKLEEGHALRPLCDVYTYTAMIAQCIYQQDVDRALELANEMSTRNIERNVHTYTALMNVCIKCGRCPLALETYNKMRQEGCAANVVTFNTLIDVYGKMGQWEQANRVPSTMKHEGVEPVLRTYNTLMICNNMCQQPRETMNIYKKMLEEGFTPNATTYNALISAYGKAGQLDKVMEIFQEMVHRGCERSVITYSSLISACEKAGQWELALELFNEMHNEGCFPNTVTFNSLITACAQGAQWEKASEVFEEMQSQGCTPDVVTYTALISSYEKGGQWRRALAAYHQMRQRRCQPDAIVYNAIIDALWETGVIWAQRQSLALFRVSQSEGHFGQQQWGEAGSPPPRAEINLHAMTAGVAMLSLYCWLMRMQRLVRGSNPNPLPARLAIVTDKGKGSKEQGNLVVKEAVAAIMCLWQAPFRTTAETMYSGMLEANGEDVAEWIRSPGFEYNLFSFFPCADILPSTANQEGVNRNMANVEDQGPDFPKEAAVELRCLDAFSAVSHFERTHCLALQAKLTFLQNMGFPYLQKRGELVEQIMRMANALGLRQEVAHDAILLMDRTMSTSMMMKDGILDLLAVGTLMIASRQGEPPSIQTSDMDLESITGMQAPMVHTMEWHVTQMLNNDTSAISTLRCLRLYLQRMGCNFLDHQSVNLLAGRAFALVNESVGEVTFLNCRPSVIAAAVIYAERRARGIIPFWPSMLAKLTGYQDMSTPELSVAIKAAQRLCNRLAARPSTPLLASAQSIHPNTPQALPPTPRSLGST